MAANQIPPIPQDKIEENPRWREWFRNLGSYVAQTQAGGNVWGISQGGTGATSAAGARQSLGLGSMATQNSSNVAITGGTVSSAVISGGTVDSTVSLNNSTATSATTGARTLPANPAGFVIVNIGGTDYKLPYYNI